MSSRRPKLLPLAKRPRSSRQKVRPTSRLRSGYAKAIGQPTQSWYKSSHRALWERLWHCTSTTSLLKVRCGTSIPSISGEWNWARCWRRESFRSSRAQPPRSSSTTAPPTTLLVAIGSRWAGNERRHGTGRCSTKRLFPKCSLRLTGSQSRLRNFVDAVPRGCSLHSIVDVVDVGDAVGLKPLAELLRPLLSID